MMASTEFIMTSACDHITPTHRTVWDDPRTADALGIVRDVPTDEHGIYWQSTPMCPVCGVQLGRFMLDSWLKYTLEVLDG